MATATALSGIELVRSVHCPTRAVCGLEGGSTCGGSGALGGCSIRSNGAKYRQRSGVPPGDIIGGVLPPGVGGADGGNSSHFTSSDCSGRHGRLSYNAVDPLGQLYQQHHNRTISTHPSQWPSPSTAPAGCVSSSPGYFAQQSSSAALGSHSPLPSPFPHPSGAAIAASPNSHGYTMSSNNSERESRNSPCSSPSSLSDAAGGEPLPLGDNLPILDGVYKLKLGRSFLQRNSKDAFHTINCNCLIIIYDIKCYY